MKRLRESIERHQQRLSAFAILSAFIIDIMTLVRVDLYLTNIVLVAYIVIAGAGIIIINLYEDGKARFLSEEAYRWIFLVVQFCFGGLFGRFLIYYSRSGSLFVSWPFLLMLGGLLIANEVGRKHYTRLVLQVNFLFLALFAYLIFFIPVLLGRMGDSVFFLSGVITLLLISVFVWLLSSLAPARIKGAGLMLFSSLGFTFILINWLYSTNIIPPLPLSLHEAGVYHSVSRAPEGYKVIDERRSAISSLASYKEMHLIQGGSVSAYSAVFAPTNFDTSVVHDWQYYNSATGSWESRSRVTLPVVGGRDGGYRGYSIKTGSEAGFWRINIETLRGQVVGRLKFKVVYVEQKPPLLVQTLQ